MAKLLGDKLTADARARQRSGLKKGDQVPVALKSASRGERGETAERIAKIARVGRDTARHALRAHKDGAAHKKKPKPQIDKLDPKFVIGRLQKWFDFWPITQHRTVKKICAEFLSDR